MKQKHPKTSTSTGLRWIGIGLILTLPILLFQNCGDVHLLSSQDHASVAPPPETLPPVTNQAETPDPQEPGNDPEKFAAPADYAQDPNGVYVMKWGGGGDISVKTHRCTQWDNCMATTTNDGTDDGKFMFFQGGHFNVGGFPNTIYSVKIEIPSLGTELSHLVCVRDPNDPAVCSSYKKETFPFQGFALSIGQDSSGTFLSGGFQRKGPFVINVSQLPFDMGSTESSPPDSSSRSPNTSGSNIPNHCHWTLGTFIVATDDTHAGSTGCVLKPGKTYYMNFFKMNPGSSGTPLDNVLWGSMWDAYTQWLPIDPVN